MKRRSFLGALAALPVLPVLGGDIVGHNPSSGDERVTVPSDRNWMAEIPGYDPLVAQGLCRGERGLYWLTISGCD